MNKGLMEYMILLKVMKDDDKFSELLQNITNFCEKHMKPYESYFGDKNGTG